MCGFVGFRNTPEVRSPESVVKAMADRIVHRGPDDADYYVDQDVSLGFRRLSIIDLEGGRQPIRNEDGTKVLVFNGEIYNFQALREEYGKGILQKLRGMFAFVIWDKEKKELFGARDIFGIKPFYYYHDGKTFLFGSEIKSFLSHPGFHKELDEEKIPEYLSYEYIPYENTIFKNVFKLPGAHCFTYKDGKLNVERYYRIQYNIEEDKPLEYWEEAIQKEFSESVAMHQIADVEVGCFLSSGVDSSYVVKDDELFGGYPMYLQGGHFAQYSRKVPRPVRKLAGAVAKRLPAFKGKHFIIRGAMEPYQRFMRANYVFTDPAERQKYLKRPITSKAPEEYSKRYFDEVPNLDEPTQLQYVDMHTWMIYDILLKADRMSMANSLELRVPFLDKKMLELSCRIPSRYRADCQSETTKRALRSAALKQLPEKTARMKKLGFPVPLSDWLMEDKYYNKVKAAFTSDIAEKFFVTGELMKLLDDHKAGKAKNMQKIWSFYSFIVWYDQFFVKN